MVGGEGKALQHRQKKQKQKVLHVSTPSKPSTTPPPTPFAAVRFENDELMRATGPHHHLAHRHRHLQDLGGGGGGLFNPFPTPTSSPSAAPTPSPTPSSPPALTVRGQRWQERIQAALSGDFGCNFASLRVQVDMPYVSLTGICGLNNGTTPQSLDQGSSCLLVLLAHLTTLPEVMYIEPYPVLKPFNWDAAGIGQSGDATSTPAWGVGLTGEGQVVGVADTGLDVNNCFFRQTGGLGVNDTSVFSLPTVGAFNSSQRKVVQYVTSTDNTDVRNGHGTHVCGTVAGYREGSPIGGTNNFNGVAPEAKIAFFDIGDADGILSIPSNLVARLFPPGLRAGARVFSFSWGTNINTYTFLDVQIDQMMHDNRQTLVLVAAGNSGNSGARTVFSPALTKNGIAVGASMSVTAPRLPNITSVAGFSSLGPSADGRIKPDLVAPGTLLTSAAGLTACETVPLQGTSMATPVVAGLATLIRQYFMEGWYPSGLKTATDQFAPSGALLKAMLINSAVRMHQYTNSSTGATILQLGLPPDNYQGFGRPQLSRVLRLGKGPEQPGLFAVDSRPVATAVVHTYKFTVPSDYHAPPATPLTGPNQVKDAFEVTLTWTDPDSTASAAVVVLHDLDLVASLDSAGLPVRKLYPNNRAAPDNVNIIEKIRIARPSPGDVITVNVTGKSVTTTAFQEYALVASGPLIAAAWYCQDPRVNRTDLTWRTENCRLPCAGKHSKTPLCCATLDTGLNGHTCDAAREDATACTGFYKPYDCVSPSPAPSLPPTKTPSNRPSSFPTRLPSGAPSNRPSGAPSQSPSRSPSAAPSQRPTKVREAEVTNRRRK